jgi:hypothetical protein
MTKVRQLSRDVRSEQRKDKFCNKLKRGKAEGRMEYFRDNEGVIYKRRKNGEPQLVAPQSLVRDVIYQIYDLIFASHTGERRTFETICLRYWWPGMKEDVRNYVKKCDSCQRRKQGYEYRAPMGNVRCQLSTSRS